MLLSFSLLCAGKEAKELSVNVEDYVSDIDYHFRNSAKRKRQLREFMNVDNNEVTKVISHVSTRWLSLERKLTQWNTLESYLLSNFDLDDDPTENDPDEKHSREMRLVYKFKQPVSKLHAKLFQSVIPIFGSFDAFL